MTDPVSGISLPTRQFNSVDLPGAVRADDRMHGVFFDREVHVRQSLQATEPFAYVFDFENVPSDVSLLIQRFRLDALSESCIRGFFAAVTMGSA